MDMQTGFLMNLGGAFIIFVIVSIAVMIALRILLPFSIFKIRDLAEKSLEEQKKTNELLSALLREFAKKGIEKRAETDEREREEEPFN